MASLLFQVPAKSQTLATLT